MATSGPGSAPGPSAEPTLAPGPAAPAAEAAGARLLGVARDAVARGAWEEARSAARRVVDEYPATPGSGRALWFLARASLELGEAAEAARAAGAYADLLPAADDRAVDARILQARGLLAADRGEEAVRILLGLSDEGPGGARVPALVQEAVPDLSTEALRHLVELGRRDRAGAPVLAEYALGRYLEDAVGEARLRAREALSAGAEGRARAVAEAVLAGDVSAFAPVRPLLGAILPRSGSPGERRLAEMVHEGIRVALEGTSGRHQRSVRIVDADRAGAVGVEELIRQMEEQGALGVVGPLMESSLARAAGARRTPMPIVSPTARTVPADAVGVYSLSGVDPEAMVALARYARRTGIRTVVILHPDMEASHEEAQAFTRAFQEVDGAVLRRIAFARGTTDFAEQMASVRALAPDAVLLPLTERDVELVAPAVAYYGLEEDGIRVLGTAAWASPEVLRRVDPRHTEGVVAVAPLMQAAATETRARFVSEYESLFRKSLRTPIPALGYDAARLLLEAYEGGARTPEEVRQRLESIRDFPGATGVLSVRDGRIVREYRLVRLEEGVPVPVDAPRELP